MTLYNTFVEDKVKRTFKPSGGTRWGVPKLGWIIGLCHSPPQTENQVKCIKKPLGEKKKGRPFGKKDTCFNIKDCVCL